MLTDTQIKNLEPTEKLYKMVDRDGLYVAVTPSGVVSFRLDYRLHGRRETVVLGQYGPDGITLGEARDLLITAKKAIAAGKSPAKEKQRALQKTKEAKTFGEFADLWLNDNRMADSTKAMRKSIIDRDVAPVFGKRLLREVTSDDLRSLCEKIKARNAPATAVHVREIVGQVFRFAIGHMYRSTSSHDRWSRWTFIAGDLFGYRHRDDVGPAPKNQRLPINWNVVAYLHETSMRRFKHAAPEKHCECHTRPAMEASVRQGFSP